MQVGDGLLVVRSSQGKYELLFKPDKGEFANETTSVTSAKSLLEMQTCMRNISYQFVCAATDGVENLSLVKSEDWRPFEKFFEPLEKHIFSEKPLITKEGELRIFLNSNKINQSTDDDKTLLLCAFQKSTAPQKYQIEQEDSLQSGEEVPLEKPKVAASSKFSKSEAVRDVALSRSSSVNQDIIQALKLLTDELNEQGYQNVTPRLEVKTELIEVILLSNEPLVYQRSLGQAIYRCVHSLKNSRTKDITVVNYFRAGVYRRRRHWVKRLPGFLGLFL